jgi:hypothetical protein
MNVTVPFMPSNMIVPQELRGVHVEGDVFNICTRIREISERLYIIPLVNDLHGHRYCVVERCEDGVDRTVVKVYELDDRLIRHLARMMSMPLSERLAELDRNERRLEAQERENQLDDLYERLGRPMWTELERCGFIDSRPVSYPKRGVKPTKE